jgi:hypothetical protein
LATASAALLGLFIVAISLHVRLVETQPIVRNQARSNLAVLALFLGFSISGLIPQVTTLLLGAELASFVVITLFVYTQGLVIAHAEHVRVPRGVWERMTIVVVLEGLLLASSASLILDRGPGLYLAAPALVVLLPLSVFMAWRIIFSSDAGEATASLPVTEPFKSAQPPAENDGRRTLHHDVGPS